MSVVQTQLSRQDGLLPLLTEPGRVLAWLPAPAADGEILTLIHQTVARSGLGFGGGIEGIDRGQFGPSRLLVLRLSGGQVVAEFRNPNIRFSGDEAAHQATTDSHFTSVVAVLETVETQADGARLVDLAAFLRLDTFGVLQRLSKGAQKFTLARALVEGSRAKAYDDAVELDVSYTFASDTPGPDLVMVAGLSADPKAVTLVIHHSFIRLPDDGYRPKLFDPRVNEMWDIPVLDFSVPPGETVVQRYARRFRLEKLDPAAAKSRVKKPIVFHVDHSVPEPIRGALREGAAWWADAFEAAGFIDAYRVEILPEDADPMESRWNLILWNDLATPGWAFGQSALDPRTGEILRGIVYLCSQRMRLNITLFEALMGAGETNTGSPNDPFRIALSRIRQLSAHETGHSLGFQHNFIGSAEGWTTVMDYPTPSFAITGDGRIDGSDAYPEGIGSWDKFSVAALYNDGDLESFIQDGVARLGFGTDADGRIDATGMAYNAPWDRGDDPLDELDHVMRVRRIALDGFGLRNLPQGMAVHQLRRRIVPVYLYHRFQINAAVKMIGGLRYGYPVNGGGREADYAVVPAVTQRRALAALLRTLAPSELVFTDAQLELLAAQNSGLPFPLEEMMAFPSRMGRAFDPGYAIESAAELTITALLAPERLNRLLAAQLRDPDHLTLDEVLSHLISAVFAPVTTTPAEAEAARLVQLRLVLMLGRLVHGVPITTQPGAIRPRVDPPLSPTALALVARHLKRLIERLDFDIDTAAPLQAAFVDWLLAEVKDPKRFKALLTSARYDLRIPPGEPI